MLEFVDPVFSVEDVCSIFDLVDVNRNDLDEDLKELEAVLAEFDDPNAPTLEDRVNKYKEAAFLISHCPKLRRRLHDAVNEYWFYKNSLRFALRDIENARTPLTSCSISDASYVDDLLKKIIKQFHRAGEFNTSNDSEIIAIITSGLEIIERNRNKK